MNAPQTRNQRRLADYVFSLVRPVDLADEDDQEVAEQSLQLLWQRHRVAGRAAADR